MSTRLELLRALTALAAPTEGDGRDLAEGVQARQVLLARLEACGDAPLSAEEAEALEAARQGQAAWERRCRALLQDVQSQQDAARGRGRHEDAATGRLVNRLG